MDNENCISVKGQKSITVLPDVIRLDICMTSFFDSFDDAYLKGQKNLQTVEYILEENSLDKSMAKVIEFDLADMESLSKRVNPGVHYPNPSAHKTKLFQKISIELPFNYELSNLIIIKIGQRLQGVNVDVYFDLKDCGRHRTKLLEGAVIDAQNKAKIMAETAGCVLGNVMDIKYSSDVQLMAKHIRTIHSNEEAISSVPAALQICPPDFTIADTVEVSWSLK